MITNINDAKYAELLAYLRSDDNAYDQAESYDEQDKATLAQINKLVAMSNDATIAALRIIATTNERNYDARKFPDDYDAPYYEMFNTFVDNIVAFNQYCVYAANDEIIERETKLMQALFERVCPTLASEDVDYTAMLLMCNLLQALNTSDVTF